MERVFQKYHPQIVINAAAHKHVPLMENNCIEAIEHGVNRVHILDGRIPHSLLLEIFTNKGIGTAILREDGEKYYHEHE